MSATIIKANLVLPDHVLMDGYVTCRDGVITAIDATQPAIGQTVFHDQSGFYLVPGLIDLQVNGGGGRLFNDATDLADIHAIIDGHRTQGTQGILATLMCDEPKHLIKQLTLIADAIETDADAARHILGIHLEGPFFNPQKRGMHAPHLVIPPDLDWMQQWIAAGRGHIRIVTLAPELPGILPVIEFLRTQNVIVSLAHSDADYDAAHTAIQAGATMGTHLFNTMPPLMGRQPGLAGALLDHPAVHVGMINDGVHLHDSMVRLALRAKGLAHAFFVSDAMHDVSGRDNAIRYRGMTLDARNGICYNDAGALAGSAAPLWTGLQRAATQLDLSLDQAVRLCATQPADLINRMDRGRIAVGAVADFQICDADLNRTDRTA